MTSCADPAIFSQNEVRNTAEPSINASAAKRGIGDNPSYEVMSSEEFAEAWTAYQGGSIAARDKILLANQRLIFRLVHRLAPGQPVESEDFKQQGNLGLHRALQLYDPKKGAFSTYATRWIWSYLHEMKERASSDVYIPLPSRNFRSKVRKLVATLEGQGHEKPQQRAAQELGVTLEVISSMCALQKQSLDAFPGGSSSVGQVQSSEGMMADQVGSNPEDSVDVHRVSRLLDGLLSRLPEKEARVLRLYFGLSEKDCDECHAEVAREIGISRQYATTIFNEAVKKVRSWADDPSVMEALTA